MECGLDHETITEILTRFSPFYFCMADEIATTGTFHTHVFMCCDSPVRFGTIKSRFPTAHIEKAYGSAKQNREYIQKSGIWSEDAKAETVIEGSFFEHGNLPTEKEGKHSQMYRLINNIRDGMTTTEIIDDTCYTQVYITSNLPLNTQYKAAQWNYYETWQAFLRRIHKTIEYKHDGSMKETICNERTVLTYGQQQEIQTGTADETPIFPFTP